jgi:hypothetical protein
MWRTVNFYYKSVISKARKNEYMNDEFYTHGSFLCMDGPAKKLGLKFANVKVCITCRDSNFLQSLLLKISQDKECYWVKMSTKARDGMFLGRCFFTTKNHAGLIWAKYKMHPRLMVTLQDDDFTSAFRESVFPWTDKPIDAVE